MYTSPIENTQIWHPNSVTRSSIKLPNENRRESTQRLEVKKVTRHIRGVDTSTSTQVPSDPSLTLRHYHSRDFPLVCHGGAVHTSKALWRSTLAVVIQLMSRAGLSHASWPLGLSESEARRVWLLVRLAVSVPPERETALSPGGSFSLISNMQLILLLTWLYTC